MAEALKSQTQLHVRMTPRAGMTAMDLPLIVPGMVWWQPIAHNGVITFPITCLEARQPTKYVQREFLECSFLCDFVLTSKFRLDRLAASVAVGKNKASLFISLRAIRGSLPA